MTTQTTRWVFFVALLLVLPLPFFQHQMCWMPVARVLFVLSAESYLALSAPNLTADLAIAALAAMAICWAALLWLVTTVYIGWSRDWPSTVRGSVMSIFIFSLLLVFSSVSVYRPLIPAQGWITFLQVYN